MERLGLLLVFLLPDIRCSAEEECANVNTISIGTSPLTVFAPPNNSLCFQCNFGNGVDPNVTFQIENADINEDIGKVENGVLLIHHKANIFTSRKFTTVSCKNGSHVIRALAFLLVLLPPEVNGSAIVTEGDNLTLTCDASNSTPLPRLSWTDSEGMVLSDSKDLEIVNITKDRAGVYWCVARSSIDASVFRTSVSVTVLFCHIHKVLFHASKNLVYWKYQHNGGCLPMEVLIEQQNGDYSMLYQTVSSGLPYGTYNISGHDLIAGAEYTFRVTAVNHFGASSTSEMETWRVLLGVPGIPSRPSVQSRFEDVVVLSLSTLYPGVLEPPHSFGFNVTATGRDFSTIVVYKPFPYYVSGDNVTFAVLGLKMDTEYVLTVQAVNAFGVSNISETSTTTLSSQVTKRADTEVTLGILIANGVLVVLLLLCGIPICYGVYSKARQKVSEDVKDEYSELSIVTTVPSQNNASMCCSATNPHPHLPSSNWSSQSPSTPQHPHPHWLPPTADQSSSAAPAISSPSVSIPHSPLSPLPPHMEYALPDAASSPASLPPYLELPQEYCATESTSQPRDLFCPPVHLTPPHSSSSLHSVPCILSSPPHCPASSPPLNRNFHSFSILTTPGEEVLYEEVGTHPHKVLAATTTAEAKKFHHHSNLDNAVANSTLTFTSSILSKSAVDCSVPIEESLYEALNSTKEKSSAPSHQLPTARIPYILTGCEEAQC